MTGGPNKVEYCSGSHLKESSFRSKDLSLALALSLERGLRRIVARVRGALGAPSPKSTTVAWLAVSSHRCSTKPCITSVRIA